jgi:hypothetical protein
MRDTVHVMMETPIETEEATRVTCPEIRHGDPLTNESRRCSNNMKWICVSFGVFTAMASRSVTACPYLGFQSDGPNPHDVKKVEPTPEEDAAVLERRWKKRFERHVIKRRL